MKQPRFTPHSRSCTSPDCTGQCAILTADYRGTVVMFDGESQPPVLPDGASSAGDGDSGRYVCFPLTDTGHELLRMLDEVKDGAIKLISCIWEDTTPSYTIQLSEQLIWKPGQAADMLNTLAHLRIPVRIVTHMSDDCKGRRIF